MGDPGIDWEESVYLNLILHQVRNKMFFEFWNLLRLHYHLSLLMCKVQCLSSEKTWLSLFLNQWTRLRGKVLFTSWTSTMTYNFYCLISVYELSPIYRRNFKTNSFKGKKGIAKSVHRALYSRMQIKILKAMRWGTFWVNVIWNCVIFPWDFLPKISSFFSSVT